MECSISKIERISKRATGQTHKRLLFESMLLQLILIDKGYELVWIDEFSLSSRQDELYGWWSRGSKRYVLFDDWQFSMSFIVAFSKSVFYRIMGVEQTNNSETFGLFIKRLLSRIKSASLISFGEIILVMDNVSFHKSSFIRKLIEGKQVRILTIAP